MTRSGPVGAVLYAKDLPRLAGFYSAVLELPVRTAEDGFAALGDEPSRLLIVRIPAAIAEAIHITTPPERREETPIKIVFAIADIAAARDRAAALGGGVKPAANEWRFDGATVCDGHDPEGNIFQLQQRP